MAMIPFTYEFSKRNKTSEQNFYGENKIKSYCAYFQRQHTLIKPHKW